MQSHAMELNGTARHRSPLPPPPNTVHLVNGNGTIEQWSKITETNGQNQVSSNGNHHLNGKLIKTCMHSRLI